MKPNEEQQAKIITQRAYKTALRVPISPSIETLLALGLHNTFQELKGTYIKGDAWRLLEKLKGGTLLCQLSYTE
ncbi:hypothetical protein HPB48_013840 [Haemaphysalis longicornis]|uniref:Uncharacterized protein n=1 Tax=Haemaphysalis longicornis TaxID=44386 RepID=A0A9J6GSE1_HAELO|nr:hypothetical protein HPB48_013840 [Haemaphysalis longicornis]